MLASPALLSILISALFLFISLIFINKRNSRKLKIQQRLNATNEEAKEQDIANESKDSVATKEKNRGWLEKKSMELEHAQTNITMTTYMIILCLSILTIFTVSYALTNILILALLLSLLGILVPEKIVSMKKEKNIDNFNMQFIKALKRISSVVRSGGSLKQAIIDVSSSRSIPPAVKLEFKRVLWDIEYGKTIAEAMYGLYERTGSDDARDIAIIIEIQTKYGGNLPQILDKKAKSISTRKLMQSGIKSKLATAKSSANILCILFGSLGFIIYLLSPHYFDPMFHSLGGRLVLLFCLGMEVFGYFIVAKLMKVEI